MNPTAYESFLAATAIASQGEISVKFGLSYYNVSLPAEGEKVTILRSPLKNITGVVQFAPASGNSVVVITEKMTKQCFKNQKYDGKDDKRSAFFKRDNGDTLVWQALADLMQVVGTESNQLKM